MTYSISIDLRKRVVEFVRQGGSKAEASRRYEVSLWCVLESVLGICLEVMMFS